MKVSLDLKLVCNFIVIGVGIREVFIADIATVGDIARLMGNSRCDCYLLHSMGNSARSLCVCFPHDSALCKTE
jgi:hypothetical protein